MLAQLFTLELDRSIHQILDVIVLTDATKDVLYRRSDLRGVDIVDDSYGAGGASSRFFEVLARDGYTLVIAGEF